MVIVILPSLYFYFQLLMKLRIYLLQPTHLIAMLYWIRNTASVWSSSITIHQRSLQDWLLFWAKENYLDPICQLSGICGNWRLHEWCKMNHVIPYVSGHKFYSWPLYCISQIHLLCYHILCKLVLNLKRFDPKYEVIKPKRSIVVD